MTMPGDRPGRPGRGTAGTAAGQGAAGSTAGQGDEPGRPGRAAVGGRTAGRGRSAMVVGSLLVGSLLVPLGLVANWGRVLLTDTDVVVATLAPLASDPAVKAYATDLTTDAVMREFDVAGVLDRAFGGLAGVVPGAAGSALQSLGPSLTDAARSTVHAATARIVESDSFPGLWSQALGFSHRELVAALNGDPQATLTVTQQGIGVRLAPLGQAALEQVAQRGVPLARSVPVPEVTVVVAPGSDLSRLRTILHMLRIGSWAPVPAAVLLLAGVVLARRRIRTLAVAAAGVAAGSGLVLVAVPVIRQVLLARVPASTMPAEVLGVLYARIFSGLATWATVTAVVAAIVAVLIVLGLVVAGSWRRPAGRRAPGER